MCVCTYVYKVFYTHTLASNQDILKSERYSNAFCIIGVEYTEHSLWMEEVEHLYNAETRGRIPSQKPSQKTHIVESLCQLKMKISKLTTNPPHDSSILSCPLHTYI